MKSWLVVVCITAGAAAACNSSGPARPTATPTPVSPLIAATPVAGTLNFPAVPVVHGGPVVTLPDGLKYVDVTKGPGAAPVAGKSKVTVTYTGWLLQGYSFTQGAQKASFTFVAGANVGGGSPLAAIDEALNGMKVGGKRRLYIPWQLGYGAKGLGNGFIEPVPPYSPLVVDVELTAVN